MFSDNDLEHFAELVTMREASVWEDMFLKALETTAMDDLFEPEVILLRDEYVAALGVGLKDAMFLAKFAPATARTHITAAVQAQLHALADEAAPAPAQHRARARL